MGKIVKRPLKIDFHIHSVASCHKDINVSESSIENIDILINNLIDNEVNMIAITDHDNFNYDIYNRLKEEELKDNCILKVFPAVEFSVYFENLNVDDDDQTGSILHVISIFNDNDTEKLLNLQELLFCEDTPRYDYEDKAFTENTFNEILRNIGLDTILIAHQKESITSKNKRDHDANTLNEERFNEIIFVEYFEAFEFRNVSNESYNRQYVANNVKDLNKMKFVTGSDCHIWADYPTESEEYKFTYLKCLPSFRGLVMAFTDYSRIKVGTNSFFSIGPSCDSFDLIVNGVNNHIELSKGINVIIGDNSIGKSLLLHALTGYKFMSSKTLEDSYKKYLSDKSIDINTLLEDKDIFIFDAQGDIRKMFQNNEMFNRDFLCAKFPEVLNFELEKNNILHKIDKFLNNIESLKYFSDNKDNEYLIKVDLLLEENKCISITNCYEDFSDTISTLNGYIDDLDIVINKLLHISDNNIYILNEDIDYIKDNIDYYMKLRDRIIANKEYCRKQDLIIENLNNCINNKNSSLKNFYTDADKERELSRKKIIQMQEWLSKITVSKIQSSKLIPDIVPKVIDHDERSVETTDYKYIFTHKSNIEVIDEEYFKSLLLYPIDRRKWSSLEIINYENVNNFINCLKGTGTVNDWKVRYKNTIHEKLDEDFLCKPIILCNYSEKFIELSSGGSARSYFDLLSIWNNGEGIYIVDQPEDDISQLAIKQYLIKQFRDIALYHQIIIVTHNPQFVVNLDVDNVIYLSKKENGIQFNYGALEYYDKDFDVLETVANVLDGGINAIRERYKRYGKSLQTHL